MNVNIDYIVVTYPQASTVSAHEPQLRALVRAPRAASRAGYRGHAGLQSFCGYSDYSKRLMFIATGAYAQECAARIPEQLDTYASFARVDIQATFKSSDADEFIAGLKHARRYQATRVTRDDARGSTFYVGSRSSALFARVYNKSAESDIFAEDLSEFVRVEFCLRDKYADSAWQKFRSGKIESVFAGLVERMFDEISAKMILSHASLELTEREKLAFALDASDWRERRLAWLESTVVPALQKLMTEDTSMIERVWFALDNLPKL